MLAALAYAASGGKRQDGDVATTAAHPSQTAQRLHRGGGWNSSPDSCRAAQRANTDATYTNTAVGFRVCRSE